MVPTDREGCLLASHEFFGGICELLHTGINSEFTATTRIKLFATNRVAAGRRELRQCPPNTFGFEQLRQLFACVEHAGFDGVAADSGDLGNFLH
jgi:hypothetical protein